MLLGWLFPLLAFVPGIPVVALISKKLGYKLSVLELILAGFTLWNYVLVAPALLLGLFSNVLVQYFSIFTLISSGICVLSLAWVLIFVIKNKSIKIKISWNQSNLLILLLVICLSFFVLLTTMFHPLYLNSDVIAIYLPFSKSIALTGGLQYEIFHLSEILTTQSPMLPLIYAWVISETGPVGLSTLPFVYFFMILVAIFLVTKVIIPKNVAPISLLAFLVMPAVISTMAYHSLYLEIAFTCYFMATLFMVIKANKCKNLFYYLLVSLSMFLFMLSRFELAIFLTPSFLAILLYFKFKGRFKRMIITILFGLGFWALLLFNLFSELSFEWKSFLMFSVLPLLIAYSVIVYLLLGRICKPNLKLNDRFRAVKEGIVLIFPLFPVAIYLARNVIKLGCINMFFLWNSSYQEVNLFFSNILNVQLSAPSMLDIFRWDKLFLSEALIAPFFLPFFIGLIFTVYGAIKRKLNSHYLFFVLVFLNLFISWAWLYRCDVIIRKLFVFAPFASIFVAYGAYKLARFFGSTRGLIARFAVCSVVIFSLVWVFKVKAT
ncbi:MAG: hypothetical protein D4S01_02265, partial [Dehalococcoidia bacterium]